jgi:hypothetical protein
MEIFINMGRKMKLKDERKIRFGVSLDPNIYKRMIKEKINKSKLIEKLLKQYYGD